MRLCVDGEVVPDWVIQRQFDPEEDAARPDRAWPEDVVELIARYRDVKPDDLPASPFEVLPSERVADPVAWLEALRRDIAEGPGGPRAAIVQVELIELDRLMSDKRGQCGAEVICRCGYRGPEEGGACPACQLTGRLKERRRVLNKSNRSNDSPSYCGGRSPAGTPGEGEPVAGELTPSSLRPLASCSHALCVEDAVCLDCHGQGTGQPVIAAQHGATDWCGTCEGTGVRRDRTKLCLLCGKACARGVFLDKLREQIRERYRLGEAKPGDYDLF